MQATKKVSSSVVEGGTPLSSCLKALIVTHPSLVVILTHISLVDHSPLEFTTLPSLVLMSLPSNHFQKHTTVSSLSPWLRTSWFPSCNMALLASFFSGYTNSAHPVTQV